MIAREREAVIALHNGGFDAKAIARTLSLGLDGVLRIVDPEWAEKRRDAINRNRKSVAGNTPKSINPARAKVESFRPSAEQVDRLRRLIPPDTRDITGVLCGDPLPTRSALDKRMGRAG